MPRNTERRLSIVAAGSAAVFVLGLASASPAADLGTTCALKKRAAADKLATGFLKCVSTAVGKGAAVDSRCFDKSELKLTLLFDKAEDAGGCVSTGDAGAVQTAVESCVAQVRGQLADGARCL